MGIIPFYQNEKKLVKNALTGDGRAQKALYDRYAPKMLGVCRQYIKDVHYAEDVMINGFVKVFKHLHSFGHKGSFEGWVRKIMVRESISYLRKRQFVVFDDDLLTTAENPVATAEDVEGVAHIQALIDALPEGYKMVFVLYVVEGYKHHEIAEMLGISEGTSKSQLFKARKLLQENLKMLSVTTTANSK